jgi:hypothetical protein
MKNIELNLLDLPNGTIRIICPRCNGGSGGEKSLAVSKLNEDVKWYCHRASCNEKGMLGNPRTENFQPTRKLAVDMDYDGYVRQTVLDNSGVCKGWVHRLHSQYVPTARTPKSLNNYDSEWCGMHFPRRVSDKHILAVEDRASAEKIAPYFPVCALLGTTFTQDKSDYLLQQGISCVIIGLDEDAQNKALKLKREWWLIKHLLPLKKDIKNMSNTELLHTLNDLGLLLHE